MLSLRQTFVLFTLIGAPFATVIGQESSRQILARGNVAAVEHNETRPVSFPKLRPRSLAAEQETSLNSDAAAPMKASGSLITVCSSLAVVLGLFSGLVWMTRKFGSKSGGQRAIPKEVIQPLGSTAIDARTKVTMLRCGNRILVLAQTPQGVQLISEITSSDEVLQLTAACLGDSKQAFATTLQSIERERASNGFLDAQTDQRTPPGRGRLFASA